MQKKLLDWKDKVNFKIYDVTSRFFYMTKSQDKKLNILRTKRALNEKAVFIYQKFSQPESAPLNCANGTKSRKAFQLINTNTINVLVQLFARFCWFMLRPNKVLDVTVLYAPPN